MATSSFLQEGPQVAHPWDRDPWLRALVDAWIPKEVANQHAAAFRELAGLASGEMLELSRLAEAFPPRHVPFDPWGRRIDRIEVHPSWKRLHALAAQHGVVASAYSPSEGPWARLVAAVKLFLYHPSSAIASCPLAMTDGAARVLVEYGSESQKARFLPHLLATEPSAFWTSGQWMTERTGGSDVSGTETVAEPLGQSRYALTGIKWFSSATTAEIALALARLPGSAPGSRGLSLFLIELQGQVGQTIRVLRLKDKLGTRALPTAELELERCQAELVGTPNRGVAQVATMLNITRLYNSVCAAGSLARGVALAVDYAAKRSAFGRKLWELPAHRGVLADLLATSAATTAVALDLALRMGRLERGVAAEPEARVTRTLTPVVKLWTARRAVEGLTEAIEAVGGAGYIEDTGLPSLLRDAHVLPIWEGTTNVLALDFLRALEHDAAWDPLKAELSGRIEALGHSALKAAWQDLAAELGGTWERVAREARARTWAFQLGQLLERLLVAELAAQVPSSSLFQAVRDRLEAVANTARAGFGAAPGPTMDFLLAAAEAEGWCFGESKG